MFTCIQLVIVYLSVINVFIMHSLLIKYSLVNMSYFAG